MRYGDSISKMFDGSRLVINKFDSLWWKNLSIAGKMMEEKFNRFSNSISCKISNGQTIEFWRDKMG